MLEVKDIRASYGRIEVLRGMTLRVPKSHVVAMLGGNGAGKSTTMKCIVGLVSIQSGSVELNGERIEHLPPHRRAQLGIAMSPQHRELFPEMTVKETLEISAISKKLTKSERVLLEDRILSHFPRLRERYEQQAGTLSGGEQQMLATARALMLQPSVLLLDEPTAGLAPVMAREVMAIIKELKAENLTIFIVEQNVRVALQVADYVYIGRQGAIVAEGEVSMFSDEDTVFRQYFGAA
jgi:branched-chain amino acid transport system ATP-binding protein